MEFAIELTSCERSVVDSVFNFYVNIIFHSSLFYNKFYDKETVEDTLILSTDELYKKVWLFYSIFIPTFY